MPPFTLHPIAACAAEEAVSYATTEQFVVIVLAFQCVRISTSGHAIVTVAAEEAVVAGGAEESIDRRPRWQ